MMRVDNCKAVLYGFLMLLFLTGCTGEEEWIPLGDRPETGVSIELTGDDPSESVPDYAESRQETAEAEMIYVYVCGAVQNPGVVELPKGSRANDALLAAGGFREDAETDSVNLAARLSDGEKLYFPAVGENEGESTDLEMNRTGLVDINTAGEEVLCTLTGIGPSKAKDIISYREKKGPFKKIEDIMKVPGIKSGLYESIKDAIVVE